MTLHFLFGDLLLKLQSLLARSYFRSSSWMNIVRLAGDVDVDDFDCCGWCWVCLIDVRVLFFGRLCVMRCGLSSLP